MCVRSEDTWVGALTARVKHLDSIWSAEVTTQEREQVA